MVKVAVQRPHARSFGLQGLSALHVAAAMKLLRSALHSISWFPSQRAWSAAQAGAAQRSNPLGAAAFSVSVQSAALAQVSIGSQATPSASQRTRRASWQA